MRRAGEVSVDMRNRGIGNMFGVVMERHRPKQRTSARKVLAASRVA